MNDRGMVNFGGKMLPNIGQIAAGYRPLPQHPIILNINKNFTIMLKNTIIALLLTIGLATTTSAQRIAYVDVEAILESIAEYQEAQTELEALAARWRTEIASEYDEIKGEYNRYQAEQVLLSDEARRAKEEEIMEMEKKVRELQKERFGPNGLLFEKRKELVQPIQDRVYGAIEDYAGDRGYDFIFDKSGSAGMIFASPEYDKTNDVIDRIRRN